jgi:hypothetical protein
MKLRIKPIYGWGWFGNSAQAIEVPAPFDLEVEIIEGNAPFATALGQMNEAGHPLSGLWLLLSQRHSPHDGFCNLWAFKARPDDLKRLDAFGNKPWLDGFAAIEVILR